MLPRPQLPPVGDVEPLLRRFLDLLQARSGFALVMATRVVGPDWHVVSATENAYGVAAGDVFRWEASICSRMARSGDRRWSIADVEQHDEARDAPVRRHLPIISYVGDEQGALLGTVCAIDPDVVDLAGHEDLFDFAADLTAHAFGAGPARARSERAAERAPHRSVDAEEGATMVPAEAWRALVAIEAARVAWTGEPLSVGLVRGPSGDTRPQRRLQELAEELRRQGGPDDVVALLGSNRLGLLCVGRTAEALRDQVAAVADADLTTVASDVSGTAVAELLEELESELVGASAAAARSASMTVVFSFCDSCGRKGRYASRVADVTRCKFCGALDAG